MSVVAIRYKNFMAFQDTGWLELRPICLLFGRNSSGKSAIIRGLRLLKQSLRIEEAGAVKDRNALRFAVEGQLDLGNFRATLHQHTESANDDKDLEAQKITFAFRIELPDLTAKLWQRIQQASLMDEMTTNQHPSYIELNLEFGYDNSMDVVRLVGVHLDCPSTIAPDSTRVVFISAIRAGELVQLSHPDQAGSYTTIWSNKWYWASDCGVGEQPERDITGVDIEWIEVELVRHLGFLPQLRHKNILKVTENLAQVDTDYALAAVALRSISMEISSFLQDIQHLGPMRPKPERVYMLDRFEMDHWRAQGLGAWLAFITTTSDSVGKSDEQTTFNEDRNNEAKKSFVDEYYLLDSTIQPDPEEMTKETLTKSFQEQMDEWIKILHLGHEVQVEANPMQNKLGYTPQVYIVKENGKRDNLADVGYGASQVLPLIATCLRAKPGSLVIVEQPELHLHPSAQAELGDLFIQTIAQIEEDEKSDGTKAKMRKLSGRQVLIETHSEHLLLRTRRRIAESTSGKNKNDDETYLSNSEVKALFVDKEAGISTLEAIEISQFGEMASPEHFKGFFADDAREVALLTEARLKGMMAKQ